MHALWLSILDLSLVKGAASPGQKREYCGLFTSSSTYDLLFQGCATADVDASSDGRLAGGHNYGEIALVTVPSSFGSGSPDNIIPSTFSRNMTSCSRVALPIIARHLSSCFRGMLS